VCLLLQPGVNKPQVARFDVSGQRVSLGKGKRRLPLTTFQQFGDRVMVQVVTGHLLRLAGKQRHGQDTMPHSEPHPAAGLAGQFTDLVAVLIDVGTRAAGFLKHLVERQCSHGFRLSVAAAAGARSRRTRHRIRQESVKLLSGQQAIRVDGKRPTRPFRTGVVVRSPVCSGFPIPRGEVVHGQVEAVVA
jgi:hypothetical protein